MGILAQVRQTLLNFPPNRTNELRSTILGAAFALVMCFIPETLPRIVISRAAKKSDVVDPNELAVLDAKVNVFNELRFVSTMALKIMVTEPIVMFLAVYNGFAYGLLFLYLDGVFDVFVLNNGLSYASYVPKIH
jgi:hypothetical protein